jgi:hypothetical protein
MGQSTYIRILAKHRAIDPRFLIAVRPRATYIVRIFFSHALISFPTMMIPSRVAILLRPMSSRTFTSHTVNGFVGAVGNTPLVRDLAFSSEGPHV